MKIIICSDRPDFTEKVLALLEENPDIESIFGYDILSQGSSKAPCIIILDMTAEKIGVGYVGTLAHMDGPYPQAKLVLVINPNQQSLLGLGLYEHVILTSEMEEKLPEKIAQLSKD